MATKTEMCNLAISNLGIGIEIQDIETENSAEAKACRRYFDTTSEVVLKDFDWPFATKITPLNLVEECPNNEWQYSYRYPSDCLHIRRLLPAEDSNQYDFITPGQRIAKSSRIETHQTRVPYRITKDDTGKLIYTDQKFALIEYTELVGTQFYPSDFVMAFSFRLASYIAPRITRGDPFKMKQEMMQAYRMEISAAQANALNEEQPDQLPESEFIRARE